MTLLDNFTNTTDHAVLEAKTASISQRLQEKLALDRHLHTLEQAIVLRYIVATKLMQGDFPLAKQREIVRQLAKLDASLCALGELLDEVRAEAKAKENASRERTPVTLDESLALLQEADDGIAADDEPDA